MAGRAGRRGLDATGTVIIAANDDLPEVSFASPLYPRELNERTLRPANNPKHDDFGETIEAAVAVPTYLQHDS